MAKVWKALHIDAGFEFYTWLNTQESKEFKLMFVRPLNIDVTVVIRDYVS